MIRLIDWIVVLPFSDGLYPDSCDVVLCFDLGSSMAYLP